MTGLRRAARDLLVLAALTGSATGIYVLAQLAVYGRVKW